MKLLHNHIFKHYYPVKDVSDLFHMPQNDIRILKRWLERIESEVNIINCYSAYNASINGHKVCRQIYIHYDRSIKSLSEKLDKLSSYSFEIDEKDIDFINDVIYRHKYIGPISEFIFPIRKNDAESIY